MANANIAVDLTKTYMGDERRLSMSSWEGSGDITVNGTPTNPTSGSVTLNEFELGSTTPDNASITQLKTNGYSGTMTFNDYVNAEVRENTPAASYAVNQNAVFEVGHDAVTNIFSTEIGEVTVNNGGTLEVGHETDGLRVPYSITLTKSGGKSGGLTLNSGARTLLQVSGIGSNQYDRIFAQGDVTLGGTLEVLISPPLTAATTHATQDGYTPMNGDTFDLFAIGPVTVDGDYDGNGTVGPEDYNLWRSTFGSTTVLDADGNGNNVVDAADYVVWRNNEGAVGGLVGTIDTGTSFSSLFINDPNNVLAGFTAALNVTPSVVQLVIHSVPGVGAAVPEPAAIGLAIIALAAVVAARTRR